MITGQFEFTTEKITTKLFLIKMVFDSESTWMGDRISMSISVDIPLDEILNYRGPLALLLRRQYGFHFWV